MTLPDTAAPAGARALRGRVLSFVRKPEAEDDRDSFVYLSDGLILIEGGKIAVIGDAGTMLAQLPPGTPVESHASKLLLPGFIDLHIHMPQTRVIASYGAQLLDWLARYTFIEEQKYADPAHAMAGADFFLDELLRNGTTTAVVYGSVHAASVEAMFTQSARRGTCMIAGKVMMDRNAPPALCDTAQSAYDDSRALIERWHGVGRQRYAVTPRFAITSTEAQLEAAGSLMALAPDLYMQTHLSENTDEIAAVKGLFPAARDYTDVYDRYGLLGERALFGHCIHLSDEELDRLSESRSVAVSCPTSNLFLGSGLFDQRRLDRRAKPVRTGLATDVGGGTSYSMLRTGAEFYKVQQLLGHNLPAVEAFYRMTRANAEALGMGTEIGSLEPGCHADIIVLDSTATPAMAHRMESVESLEEELFVLLTLGDDRSVAAVYVNGERVAA